MKIDNPNELNLILSPETNFIEEVEEHVVSANVDYFDAIITWCERRKIEFEQIIPVIKQNPAFRMKLTCVAEKLSLLKKK